jgi:hypothetical protein
MVLVRLAGRFVVGRLYPLLLRRATGRAGELAMPP